MTPSREVDVLIVGAGLSGIGSACHLARQCPDLSFAIVEAMDGIGGTWRLHRYPGVRSDSDLYSYAYGFKPWSGQPFASGAEIAAYLAEVVAEHDLGGAIHCSTRVTACAWSSADARWTVRTTGPGGEAEWRCRFLWMCQGYYDHDRPYLPEWPGMADFAGPIVHPQHWDEALDWAGKRVLVIGSGATAVTLVPALAEQAAQVTMLQRSPGWYLCHPGRSELADRLRAIGIDEPTVACVVRQAYIHDQRRIVRRAREEPEALAQDLRRWIGKVAGKDFALGPEFTPAYQPWQQRLAAVPDGDLFRAIAAGRARIVTGEVARFARDGVELADGRTLAADIVVAATGFRLAVMGGIPFTVDDRPIDWSALPTWRGILFAGVPNLAWTFGYLRAAWTLRVDLIGEFVCRLLRHMDGRGAASVAVEPPAALRGQPLREWIDAGDFNPGYLRRDIARMPRRVGEDPEWRPGADDEREALELPAVDLDAAPFRYVARSRT